MVDMSNVKPVIQGQFEDDEWRAAAAKKAGARNRREAQIVRRGPRLHPYSDSSVYVDESVPETVRFFEDEDHYKAYTKKHEAKGPPTSPIPPTDSPQAQLDAKAAQAETDRANRLNVGTRAKGA